MDEKQLKETLETFWTTCAPKGHLSEYDHLVSGIDSDDTGASRLAPSGESCGNGTEVRIKFKSKN